MFYLFYCVAEAKMELLASELHIQVVYLSKGVEVSCGISTDGQDEDKGCGRGGVLVDEGQVRCLGFNELLSEVLGDKVLHRVGKLVRSDTLQEEKLLEETQLCHPFTRQISPEDVIVYYRPEKNMA